MSRIVRKMLQGQVFHVMSQGINREYIFEQSKDKEKYFKLMKKYTKEFNIHLIAYCIMHNHVHLLIKTEKIDYVSNFMRMVNGKYAIFYNQKYNRVGFVFRGRFKSKVILSEKSLYQCIKYIHMNPVKANIVKKEEEYEFSSYKDFQKNIGICSIKELEEKVDLDQIFFNQDFELEEDRRKICAKEILNVYLEKKKITMEQMKGDLNIKKEFLKDIKRSGIDKDINKVQLSKLLGIARCSLYKYLKKETFSALAPNVCGICECINKDKKNKKCTNKLNEVAEFGIEDMDLEDYYFERLIYIFNYEGFIRKLILDYKFNEKSYIYVSFVNFILKNKKIFQILKSYDTIIPVPISKKRMKERGYNQSLLIARNLSEYLNINLCTNCLYKTKNIIEQSKLNKEQRKQNIQNVYQLKNKQIIKEKKILLIDDIYTTGSTVNECSKILKIGQPEKIDVLVLAKD